jgi:hypothetical protein
MELFSGAQNIWPQEGVAHQGFSSTGVVLPLVRGLLGLDGSALKRKISFRPSFPADWTSVSISNGKVGQARFSLEYTRAKDSVMLRIKSEKAAGFDLTFEPAFGLGTKVLAATRNGSPLVYAADERPSAQAVRPRAEFALSGDDTVEMRFAPAPEVIPPDVPTITGDLSRGLRIIGTGLAGRDLKISLEGLAGETYTLEVLNGDRVEFASGGEFDGRKLKVAFPAGGEGVYVRGEVTRRIKD